MATETRMSDLTPSRGHLVRVMDELRFGRIDGLRLQCGEPVMTPPPTILKSAKFGSRERDEPTSRSHGEHSLKQHLRDLFEFFDGLGDAESIEIVVQEGLPIRANANVTGTIGRPRDE